MAKPSSAALGVRPFRSTDRDAVRHICCETAFAGGPVEPLFPDRDAFADFFTRYYTDWEPESALVGEVDGEVVGYVLACTRPWRYAVVQPAILLLFTVPKVAWRLLTGRYGAAGRRFLRWFVLRSWRETPSAPSGAAHFHFNALAGHRNTGTMLRLFRAFYALLHERGVERVYGQIQTGSGSEAGWRSEKLFARWDFHPYDRRRISKFDGLRDEEVWVTTLVHDVRSGEESADGVAGRRRGSAVAPPEEAA